MKKTLAVSMVLSTLPLKGFASDWGIPATRKEIRVTTTHPEYLIQVSTAAQIYSIKNQMDYLQMSLHPKQNSATIFYPEKPAFSLEDFINELKSNLGDSVKIEKVPPSEISAGTQDDQVSSPTK